MNHVPPVLLSILAQHDETLPSGLVFVVCIDCGKEASFRSEDVAAVSNDEAIKRFEKRGWTVLPTRCPACKKKA